MMGKGMQNSIDAFARDLDVLGPTSDKTAVNAMKREILDTDNHLKNGGDPEEPAGEFQAKKEEVKQSMEPNKPVRTEEPPGEPEVPNFETLRAERDVASKQIPEAYRQAYEEAVARDLPNIDRNADIAENWRTKCQKI